MPFNAKLFESARSIKAVIMDVDGVLTDGKLVYSDNGELCKSFHAHDGLAIKLLIQAGIVPAVISSRHNTMTYRRLCELGVKHIELGHANKIAAFTELLSTLGLAPDQCLYLGDDLPDLALIAQAGIGVATADAADEARHYADYVTAACGGAGAVREVCRQLLLAHGVWHKMIDNFSTTGGPT